MAPFDRPHTSSYSSSIVTMAVSLAISEIFSVKEWPDLEMWVWGCSRSLKMARFDRPCMTFYLSAIVTITLSCTGRCRSQMLTNDDLRLGLPDLKYFSGAPVFRPPPPVSRTEAKISRVFDEAYSLASEINVIETFCSLL